MALNMIIGNRMEVVKPIQLTADPHVENIEMVTSETTPDMKIVIEFGKMRAEAKRVLVLSNKCLEKKTCLDKGTRADVPSLTRCWM